MTRFARAKGSKSSNERVPDEATPWHVMKLQLEESAGRDEVKKTKNAKQLLAEKDTPFYSQSLGNVKNDWAEFDEVKQPKGSKDGKKDKVKKSNKVVVEDLQASASSDSKNVKKSKGNSLEPESDINSVKKRNKKKKITKGANGPPMDNKKTGDFNVNKSKNQVSEDAKPSDADVKNKSNIEESSKEKGLSKRQKRNQKRKGQNDSQPVSENGKEQKRRFDGSNSGFDQRNEFKRGRFEDNRFDKPGMNNRKRKPPKVRDDKEHKRRKNDLEPVKMTINGISLEIVKFDGFPVKKEDAERLKELKQQMIMKGIPTAEVNAAMKLERRKAEKALARVRKQVCFHCRKAGHVLSDCPELGAEEVSAGICFKCGSTEHTHFECKVVKTQEFRHASCFICREQGHIAKQCPDNPKGLYPQGGACKICGDVTHLKKDCPDLVQEKTETIITAEKLQDNNLESLDEEIGQKSCTERSKPQKSKVVKF